MNKGKKTTKGQTIIYNTLHRKLKIEQHDPQVLQRGKQFMKPIVSVSQQTKLHIACCRFAIANHFFLLKCLCQTWKVNDRTFLCSGIDLASFYDCSIRSWNCSHSVGIFTFLFITHSLTISISRSSVIAQDEFASKGPPKCLVFTYVNKLLLIMKIVS